MSVTTSIENISNHLKNAYDELQGLGADLTNVNKNIENISMVLDNIYDSMPRVSEEGISLTLDNTKVGKIKSTLKGNISQYSTTGKNMFDSTLTNQTLGGVTISYNNDGTITFNGTATSNATSHIFTRYPNFQDAFTLQANTSYTFSLNKLKGTVTFGENTEHSSVQLWKKWDYTFQLYFDRITDNKLVVTKTPSAETIINAIQVAIRQGDVFNNFTISLQLEQNNQETDWEEYTGGIASPNLDYPQDIQVVSGKNNIYIANKNLIKMNNQTTSSSNLTAIIDNGIVTINGTSNATAFLFLIRNQLYLPAGTYTLSAFNPELYNDATFDLRITGKNGDGILGRTFLNNINSSTTFTLSQDLKEGCLQVRASSGDVLNNFVVKPQLERGTQATSQEIYKENVYPIDFGAQNLYFLPEAEEKRGIQYSFNEDGTINLKGTATDGNAEFIVYKNVNETNIINGKTYTLFCNQELPWGVEFLLEAYNEDILQRHVLNGVLNYQKQIWTNVANTTDATRIRVKIYIKQNVSVDISNLWVQLVEGSSTYNTFTPFGESPLELCGSDDNQDYLYKDNNKWYKLEKVHKVTLTGYENYSSNKEETNTIRFTTPVFANQLPKTNNIGCYASNFKIANESLRDGMSIYSNDKKVYIWIQKSIASTPQEFKNLIMSNPINIYYILATPIIKQITDSSLINQLDNLEKAKSYNEETNVWQDNNDLPFIIEAQALKKYS